MNPDQKPVSPAETTTPLISIIIPTLNEEKLITKTLSQFTSQIKKQFRAEVIISDGGSNDGTMEIVQGKADKVITSKPEEKRNISIGRNRGALNSGGNYLYFLNADTRLSDADYFFKRTSDELSSPQAAALTCNIRVFPEEEILSDKIFHGFYNFYVSILNKVGMGMGRGECHIIKKEIFEGCGGYDETMPAGEDYDLYRRVAKLGKIKFLRDVTVFESPRRYRKYGYMRVLWEWTRNSISVLFRNKAVSKEWKPVR